MHMCTYHTNTLLASSSEQQGWGGGGLDRRRSGEGCRGTDVVQGLGPESRREGIYDQTRVHPVYIFQDPSD